MGSKFTTFALMTAMSATASATDIPFNEANRTLYGCFDIESIFDGQHGYGSVNSNRLDIPELLWSFDTHDMSLAGAYAGAGADGVIYTLLYQFNGSWTPPTPLTTVAYDINTNTVTNLGPWAPVTSFLKAQDMTYDKTTETMYAMTYELGKAHLMKLDLETGALSEVCEVKSDLSFATLAASPDGDLYTIGIDGVLYRLHKKTGALAKVFDTGYTGFEFVQTMEFDPTTGNIIWAANAQSLNPNEVELVEIDLHGETPQLRVIDQLGNGAVFTSLYIEGATSYDAPAKPANLAGSYNYDSQEVTLTWTNPDKTFGDQTLTPENLNGIIVFRNGEQIAGLRDVTPGAEMSFIDNAPVQDAENRYTLVAIGTGGESVKASTMVYVGQDWPAAVSGIKIEGINDYKSATISWDAVTTGYHGASFQPESTTYTVYRRPDNYKVAENIKETTITDNNIRRTLNYYYDVVASNTIGTAPAVSTPNRILGPAFETPFEEYFDQEAEVRNRWLVLDHNGDANSWTFNSPASSTFFGDLETGAEYLLSPIMGEVGDADEWLISGPIEFEADKEYEVTLGVRSIMPEVLELAFGKTEVPEEMSVANVFNIAPSEETPGEDHILISYYTAPLPTAGAEIGNVGLHLCTPVNQWTYGYLQICSIVIGEKGQTGVNSATVAPAIMTRFHNNSFEVVGEFEKVEIYNLAGVKMLESTSAVTDMSNYEAGAYVAVITTAAGRQSVKFAK